MARSTTLIGDLISDCEATSNANGSWSTGSTQDVHVRAGTFALGIKVSETTSARVLFTYTTSYNASTKDAALLFHLQVDGTVDTRANGGYRLYMEDTAGNWKEWWFGKEDVISDFVPILVHPDSTADSSSGTLDTTAIKAVGITFKVLSKALGNASNSFWDQVYWVGGVRCTSLSTDDVDLLDIYTDVDTNAWGAMLNIDGILYTQAPIFLGDTTTLSIDFNSVGEVLAWLQRPVSANWYRVELEGNTTGTSDAVIDGGFIRAGTSKYDLVFDNANTNTVSITGTTFQAAALSNFASGQTISGCTFSGCGHIDPLTATFTSNNIYNSTEATTGAVKLALTNNVDDLVFDGNTYDVYITDSGTYNNESFLHGTNTTDLHYNNASTATFNVPSDGDTATVTNDSGIMTIVAGQVTYTQSVIDKDTLAVVEGVAITVTPSDGTGPFPFQESVTITRVTTTATVTHTAHGLVTGNKVIIRGANENEFNRIKTITVTGVNAYTYTVAAGAGDATGTITSTAVIIDGLTNASGQISDTRGYGGTDQPITGTAKKGSGEPVYKSTPITGTISSTNGLNLTAAMTKD